MRRSTKVAVALSPLCGCKCVGFAVRHTTCLCSPTVSILECQQQTIKFRDGTVCLNVNGSSGELDTSETCCKDVRVAVC